MSNLFMIGNGFDLAHDLNTRYTNFREWLYEMTSLSSMDEIANEFTETIKMSKKR